MNKSEQERMIEMTKGTLFQMGVTHTDGSVCVIGPKWGIYAKHAYSRELVKAINEHYCRCDRQSAFTEADRLNTLGHEPIIYVVRPVAGTDNTQAWYEERFRHPARTVLLQEEFV